MAVTLELPRPPQSPDEFSRADLQFRGVDHSGPSYEARVFLDNPAAKPSTPTTEDQGFAGSFHVFGHGGWFRGLRRRPRPAATKGVYHQSPPPTLAPPVS